MANVTMNIDSAVWASPGSVTLANEATLNFTFGGDIIEHSAGTDTHVSGSQVVNMRGFFQIGFDDRATALSLASKLNVEATMTIKLKDIDAATGLQYAILNSRLREVRTDAQHNAPTRYLAEFYARSSDGTTSPVTPSAY